MSEQGDRKDEMFRVYEEIGKLEPRERGLYFELLTKEQIRLRGEGLKISPGDKLNLVRKARAASQFSGVDPLKMERDFENSHVPRKDIDE